MTSCCIGYKFTFGIRGVALEWICSFLTDHTQQIAHGCQLSTPCPSKDRFWDYYTDGLYTLYTADLTYVVERHGICLHQYADDSQVYVSVPVIDVTMAIQRLAVCVSSISDWMSASRLRLNPMKTEVQVSRLAASTLVTFLCCQQPSRLLSLYVTLASLSMQS